MNYAKQIAELCGQKPPDDLWDHDDPPTRYEIFAALEKAGKWHVFRDEINELACEAYPIEDVDEDDSMEMFSRNQACDDFIITLTEAQIIEACARVFGWKEEGE